MDEIPSRQWLLDDAINSDNCEFGAGQYPAA